MSYLKPWKSYADQLEQLIGRGMIISDRARALDYLKRIGYYRLSGYWFAFRERSEPLCLLDEHGSKPTKVRIERIALDAFPVGDGRTGAYRGGAAGGCFSYPGSA